MPTYQQVSSGNICPLGVKTKLLSQFIKIIHNKKFVEEVVHFKHQQFKLTAMRLLGLCPTPKRQHSLEGHIQIKHKDQAPIDDQSK